MSEHPKQKKYYYPNREQQNEDSNGGALEHADKKRSSIFQHLKNKNEKAADSDKSGGGILAGSLLKTDEAVPWSMAWRRLLGNQDDELDLSGAIAHALPSSGIKIPGPERPLGAPHNGPLAAPGEPFRKVDHPKVFLAVDRPFYLALYAALLQNIGCEVHGTTNLFQAPSMISPRERPIDCPNKYNIVFFENCVTGNFRYDISDFCLAIRSSDIEYRKQTNFLATNTIVHLVGEEENGARSLSRGANIFFRRPFVVHMAEVRELLLPSRLRPANRCRTLNKRAGFHRMLDLLSKDTIDEDDDALANKYDQEVTLKLPVLRDDINDPEEAEYLKKSVSLANRDNAALKEKVKRLEEELAKQKAVHALALERLEDDLGTMSVRLTEKEQSLAQTMVQLSGVTERMERAEATEKTRVATVKESDEVKQLQIDVNRANNRINHLVSELEKERRMNAHHRTRGAGGAGGGGGGGSRSTTTVGIQAGSGVTLFYNSKEEKEIQCELLSMDMIDRANKAQEEAKRLLEEALKAKQDSLKADTPAARMERRMSHSLSIGARSQLRREEAMQQGTATVQDFIDHNEITSLSGRIKQLELALDSARAKVTTYSTTVATLEQENTLLKAEKEQLKKLLEAAEEQQKVPGDGKSSLNTLFTENELLHREVAHIKADEKVKEQRTKLRERCLRIVIAVGAARFQERIALENNNLTSFPDFSIAPTPEKAKNSRGLTSLTPRRRSSDRSVPTTPGGTSSHQQPRRVSGTTTSKNLTPSSTPKPLGSLSAVSQGGKIATSSPLPFSK